MLCYGVQIWGNEWFVAKMSGMNGTLLYRVQLHNNNLLQV